MPEPVAQPSSSSPMMQTGRLAIRSMVGWLSSYLGEGEGEGEGPLGDQVDGGLVAFVLDELPVDLLSRLCSEGGGCGQVKVKVKGGPRTRRTASRPPLEVVQ